MKAENDVRTTLLQGVGGLLLIAGAIATWRQLHVNREGQVTERFTRAIDQLGNEKLAVRLGGIYALERIAKDSSRDHGAVMEVLTAFVRTNAPWKDSAERAADKKEQPTLMATSFSRWRPTIATDIQAVLIVIGRRVLGREERPLHLRHTDLRTADLRRTHLEEADLVGAHLDGAVLFESHLERAILAEAHLEGADLLDAHLEGAILSEAHLEGADLRWTALSDADLEGAVLSEAHLEGADISRTLGLTGEQIQSATTNEHTKLPNYLAGHTQKGVGSYLTGRHTASS